MECLRTNVHVSIVTENEDLRSLLATVLMGESSIQALTSTGVWSVIGYKANNWIKQKLAELVKKEKETFIKWTKDTLPTLKYEILYEIFSNPQFLGRETNIPTVRTETTLAEMQEQLILSFKDLIEKEKKTFTSWKQEMFQELLDTVMNQVIGVVEKQVNTLIKRKPDEWETDRKEMEEFMKWPVVGGELELQQEKTLDILREKQELERKKQEWNRSQEKIISEITKTIQDDLDRKLQEHLDEMKKQLEQMLDEKQKLKNLKKMIETENETFNKRKEGMFDEWKNKEEELREKREEQMSEFIRKQENELKNYNKTLDECLKKEQREIVKEMKLLEDFIEEEKKNLKEWIIIEKATFATVLNKEGAQMQTEQQKP